MKTQGFTLVELLAVIVILAVLALIATPVVLSIIDDTKESAMLRSAEMYLSGVENAVMRENMNSGGNFRPNECTITNGNMTCSGTEVEVEVDGEVPSTGSITFENGKIIEVTLNYESGTIIKDASGNLVYEGSENSSADLDLSTVNTDLATNTWEDVQKVVKAGKAAEAGWEIGDTKTLTINGQEKEATIIGFDHDGENTATFMITESIASHNMNSESAEYEYGDNIGGWKDSEMRSWLNDEIYNSMSNKDYIKEVTKITDNVGYTGQENEVTETKDKVFLLSVKEAGLHNNAENNWSYPYMNQIEKEGTTYELFINGGYIDDYYWLRSTGSNSNDGFFICDSGWVFTDSACFEYSVYAAFVIG